MTAWKLVYPSSPLRSKVTVKFQPLIPSVEYLILYMLVAAGCFSERNLMAAITSGQFYYRLLQYQQEVSTPSVMKVRLQTVSLKKFILYVAALSPLLLFSYLLSCRALPTAYSKPRSSQFSIGLNSSTAGSMGISITGFMGLSIAGSFGGLRVYTFNTQERVSTKRNADRTMTVLLIILLYQLIDKIIATGYIGQKLSVPFIQE